MKSQLRYRGPGVVVETGENGTATSYRTPFGRKAGVKMWLVINSSGVQRLEAGKHAIMRRASLPARDLRILDPMLTYPSTILGREQAIVVNLEHIKAIILAHEVLLLNAKDPQVAPFVDELKRRLPIHYDALGKEVPGDGGGGMSDEENTSTTSPPNRQREPSSGNVPVRERVVESVEPVEPVEPADWRLWDLKSKSIRGGPSALPFEFRALEACLEAACSSLEKETHALEDQAYPALDELTSKISTLNLERVRQIKARLVALSGRVQKVRDEIEKLLDDDGDMAEMYLTDKLSRQQLEEDQSPYVPEIQENLEEEGEEGGEAEAAEGEAEVSDRRGDEGFMDVIHSLASIRKDDDVSGSSRSSRSSKSSEEKLNVEELEMLLEAYFVQIDGTLNELSTLREYVEDTEDYITIMLDDKQNHLLQMGVMLTTATLVVSAFIVVTGIFGMNIHISLFDTGTTTQFLWVVFGSAFGALVTYFLVIGWCRWKRLIIL